MLKNYSNAMFAPNIGMVHKRILIVGNLVHRPQNLPPLDRLQSEGRPLELPPELPMELLLELPMEPPPGLPPPALVVSADDRKCCSDNNSHPVGQCATPGCSKQVFKDASGKASKYCSKTHKGQAIQISVRLTP